MRRLLLLIGVAALAPLLRAESRAIVVGVAGYPNLEARAKLRGSLGDADAIAVVLKQYGFSVNLVREADATKKAILDALAQAAKDSKPSDRFVFYFAGHGRNKPTPCIGPYDADRPGLGWITAAELSKAVKAVPASSRTVILDACFSGAMVKDASSHVSTRFYAPPATTKSPGYEDDLDPSEELPDKVLASNDICYIAASGSGQIAQEADTPPGSPKGERRGVFSYYLEKQLATSPPPVSWGAAVEAIQAEIIKNQVKLELLQPQNPSVSDPFSGQPVFAAAAPPVKPSKPTSVLGLLAAARSNPAAFSMALPDEKPLMVGEPRQVTIKHRGAGYLLVVEQVGQTFRLLYPPGAEDAEGLYVDELSPPPHFLLLCDTPGGGVLKAFFLDKTDKTGAQSLLDALASGKPVAGDAPAVTKEVMVGVSSFTTATLNLRVADGLAGGVELKDAEKAWAILKGNDARAEAFMAAIESNFPSLAERSRSEPPSDGLLKILLNVLLANPDLAFNLGYAKIPLGKLAPLATQQDAEGAIARNAQLLVALMDGALVKA